MPLFFTLSVLIFAQGSVIDCYFEIEDSPIPIKIISPRSNVSQRGLVYLEGNNNSINPILEAFVIQRFTMIIAFWTIENINEPQIKCLI